MTGSNDMEGVELAHGAPSTSNTSIGTATGAGNDIAGLSLKHKAACLNLIENLVKRKDGTSVRYMTKKLLGEVSSWACALVATRVQTRLWLTRSCFIQAFCLARGSDLRTLGNPLFPQHSRPSASSQSCSTCSSTDASSAELGNCTACRLTLSLQSPRRCSHVCWDCISGAVEVLRQRRRPAWIHFNVCG